MRCFLALPVPDDVRACLAGLQRRLRAELPGARWVRAEDLHLTLRFYGELEPERAARLAEALGPALAGAAPFELVLQGLGGFPSRQRARVVWVGVAEGGRQLLELFRRAEAAAGQVGLAPEERPFHPHVTLARLREPRSLPPAPEEPWGRWVASDVVLYRSTLTPAGPIYTPMRHVSLNGRGAGDILSWKNQ